MAKEEKGKNSKTENNGQNSNNKSFYTSNFCECKPLRNTNLKTQTEWIKQKQDLTLFCLQEIHFRSKNSYRLKVKGGKRYSRQTGTQRDQGWPYLYKTKTVTQEKEGHYIRIKGSIHQEDKTIINIYATNIRAPKYMKQIFIERKGETATVILQTLNYGQNSQIEEQ